MAPWPAYTVAGHCIRRYGELARRALLRACCCRMWLLAERAPRSFRATLEHGNQPQKYIEPASACFKVIKNDLGAQ